jgi:hypothetical protein
VSEYRYYEFLAVDRPLDAGQLDELRALSTRAHITPTSFVNTYHWGSFRGDPRRRRVGWRSPLVPRRRLPIRSVSSSLTVNDANDFLRPHPPCGGTHGLTRGQGEGEVFGHPGLARLSGGEFGDLRNEPLRAAFTA